MHETDMDQMDTTTLDPHHVMDTVIGGTDAVPHRTLRTVGDQGHTVPDTPDILQVTKAATRAKANTQHVRTITKVKVKVHVLKVKDAGTATQVPVAKAKVKVKVRARTVPMAKVKKVKDTGGDVQDMLPLQLQTQANLVKKIILKKILDRPNGNQKTRITTKNFSGN